MRLLISPIHYGKIESSNPDSFPKIQDPVIRYSRHADMPVYELVWNNGNGNWYCLCSHMEMPILEGDLWCEIPEIPDLKRRVKHQKHHR